MCKYQAAVTTRNEIRLAADEPRLGIPSEVLERGKRDQVKHTEDSDQEYKVWLDQAL